MKTKTSTYPFRCPGHGVRLSLWSQHEHETMFQFLVDKKDELIDHINAVISSPLRYNKSHFFVGMASYVRTKNEKQCKSRYQKKEKVLLEALDIPAETLRAYYSARKLKHKLVKSGKTTMQMTKSTETVSRRPKDINYRPINTYFELRTALEQEIMPRIKNEVIRKQMQKFIDSLPTDGGAVGVLPSLNMSSISQILPRQGIQIKKMEIKQIKGYFN